MDTNDTISRITIKPSIAFTTFSNSENNFRFKLMYLFEDLITTKEDYKLRTEMIFKIIFEKNDYNLIAPAFDRSCTSCSQLFLGTNQTQKVESSSTIISLELLNKMLNTNPNGYNNYNDIYKYLNLNSTDQTTSNDKSMCPTIRKNKEYIPTHDFSIFPPDGTPMNDIFTYSIYNNFHAAIIDESVKENIYYYVGNQNIYCINTYFNGKRISVGKRHQVMKYFAIVLRNMNHNINADELCNRVYWFIKQYCEKSYEINKQDVYRFCQSLIKMDICGKVGKRMFILNPEYKYLSKEVKLKELFKCKSEHSQAHIEENYNPNISLLENSKTLNYSTKTISKYIQSSTKGVKINHRSNKFEEFMQLYMLAENKSKSIRELSKLTGVSKSQVQRYLSKIRNL